jgi:hypothetical protein
LSSSSKQDSNLEIKINEEENSDLNIENAKVTKKWLLIKK